MKKSSTFLSITPSLALELRSFCSLLKPSYALYFFLPAQYIEHTEQPIDDADEIYNKNFALVLDFFTSKLHLYYSSSRLTLLLTFLLTSAPHYLITRIIPLPSRLEIIDDDALGLRTENTSWGADKCYWHIFKDFLDSNHPLALDERRCAVAALACLKILFGHSQTPVSRITWFSVHSRSLRERVEDNSQWPHEDHWVRTYLRRVAFYWHLRTPHRNRKPQEQYLQSRTFYQESKDQNSRSNHLLFLLPKSAYSNNILNFARYRVFRFGYLHRNHPTYMKRAIFALAKYIRRVTGETDQVRACESIWGRERWFAAQ